MKAEAKAQEGKLKKEGKMGEIGKIGKDGEAGKAGKTGEAGEQAGEASFDFGCRIADFGGKNAILNI